MRSLRLATVLVALTCTASHAQVVVEAGSPAIGTDGRLTENVGIETLGGVFTALLPTGCAIPCSTVQTFSTADDNQAGIKLFIYRGKARMVAQARRLGSFEIIGIPLAPRGKPSVRVTISIENGNIVMEAVDALSGKRLEIKLLDS